MGSKTHFERSHPCDANIEIGKLKEEPLEAKHKQQRGQLRAFMDFMPDEVNKAILRSGTGYVQSEDSSDKIQSMEGQLEDIQLRIATKTARVIAKQGQHKRTTQEAYTR